MSIQDQPSPGPMVPAAARGFPALPHGAGSPLRALLLVLALLAVPVLAACGGEGSEAGNSGAGEDAAAQLPVEKPTGSVDSELAARGEKLFQTRGCTACHTVGGGRKVGPDLLGVTEERDFAWLYHMVMSPDSMVKNDSIAGELLNEYLVPMADQNVQPEQFRAIFEYLRQEDSR